MMDGRWWMMDDESWMMVFAGPGVPTCEAAKTANDAIATDTCDYSLKGKRTGVSADPLIFQNL